MYEGEYTHEGEPLHLPDPVRMVRITDPAVRRVIGEIVHDLDCKDDTFRRDEVAGSGRRICASRR